MKQKILDFIQLESFSSIPLFIATILGIIIANSPLNAYTHELITHSIQYWINDGLMVLFFLLAGCEIKREILEGELNSHRKILLPIVAAIFGMIVPALIYVAINSHHPEMIRGWAISSATDIAFALGVLTLLGKRVPATLKTLLMSIAIIDDLGAIIIIALFYSQTIHWIFLFSAGCIFVVIYSLKFIRFQRLYYYCYFLLGILAWGCISHSGIHPTITGVVLALVLPLEKIPAIEKHCHPLVAFVILPLFAFINTGIPLHWNELALFSNLSLGIILGLLLGKQLGIFLSIFTCTKFGVVQLPKDVSLKMIYGLSLLCGIGFTMSLFIGQLAFQDEHLINTVRAAVLFGSLLSGIAGYWVLLR